MRLLWVFIVLLSWVLKVIPALLLEVYDLPMLVVEVECLLALWAVGLCDVKMIQLLYSPARRLYLLFLILECRQDHP